jgi:HlyD family secretion protein
VRNRFVIAAPVAGRLERIVLREGDNVSRGQTVAWIAPLPLDSVSRQAATARLNSAEALRAEAASRVDQARVALDQARNSDHRRAALLAAGAISPELREQAAAEMRSAEKDLAAALSRAVAANADVAAARAALLPSGSDGKHSVPVRAPASGRVLRVPEPSERVIAASTPIMELADAAALEVISDVLSSDAVRIHPGDAVDIVEWGGDQPLTGRVRSIEPSAFTRVSALGVDEQRVNVLVDLVNPPASLGDGFRVEIRATVWESGDVLTVPSSALFQRNGSWSVFIVQNGRAVLRPVNIGHRASALVEITGGLNVGEQVILFPSDKVDAGTRVR